jgi:hypothetical protein
MRKPSFEGGELTKAIVFVAAFLFSLSLWPFVPLVNRIEPFVFGLPFYLFWMVFLDLLVAALLAVAYYLLD